MIYGKEVVKKDEICLHSCPNEGFGIFDVKPSRSFTIESLRETISCLAAEESFYVMLRYVSI
jgi:hypothetical protein